MPSRSTMRHPELPENLRKAISKWHKKIGWDCAAHSEGQYCCLDHLLDEEDECT